MLTQEQATKKVNTFNERQKDLIAELNFIIRKLKREEVLFAFWDDIIYLFNFKGTNVHYSGFDKEQGIPGGLFSLITDETEMLDISDWRLSPEEDAVAMEETENSEFSVEA